MGIPVSPPNNNHAHLDPDNSIIAIIGAGISGLATVWQILMDQQTEAMTLMLEDDTEEEEEASTRRGVPDSNNNNNNNNNINHMRKGSKKAIKTRHRGGRLCRTIKIYEKHPDPNHKMIEQRMGYGLTITYQPDGILSSNHPGNVNDSDDITNYDCPSRSHYILNQNGSILGYYGNAYHHHYHYQKLHDADGDHDKEMVQPDNDNTNRPITTTISSQGYGQRGNIRIPRQVLCQLLLQKIQSLANHRSGNETAITYPNIEIYYNHTLKSMQEVCVGTATKVQLTLDSSDDDNDEAKTTTSIVDLVVAADGIHSAVVREWLQPPSGHPSPSTTPPQMPATTTTTTLPSTPLLPPPPPKSLNVHIILGITNDLRNVVTAPRCYSNVSDTTSSSRRSIHHELIHECGFYTLSKGHRLFVMPYTGSALDRLYDPNEPVRFMWQLSFMMAHSDNRADGSSSAVRYTSSELHQEARQRTHNWHEPVTALIDHTSTTNVWGTMLRDRNPSDIGKALLVSKQNPSPQQNQKVQRVIIIGDAMHGMSPFKGQGANQCFKDAICVSHWLYKLGHCNLRTAIQFMTREIIQRTQPIVLASRQAAEYWHSIDVPGDDNDDINRHDFTFAGVDENNETDFKRQLLIELHNRSINAGTTQHLDDTIRTIIMELIRRPSGTRRSPDDNKMNLERTSSHAPVNHSEVFDTASPISAISSASNDRENIRKMNGNKSTTLTATLVMIVDMAYDGNTAELRKVSWYQPNYLRQLRVYNKDCASGTGSAGRHYHRILWDEIVDGESSDCCTSGSIESRTHASWTTILHVAIIGGHLRTIHWLITEAGCQLNVKDSCERTAFDISLQLQHAISQEYATEDEKKKQSEIQQLLQRLQRTSLL